MQRHLCKTLTALLGGTVVLQAHAAPQETAASAPIAVQAQGSFAVGGTVVQSPGTYVLGQPGPAGQTLHGDHARVTYQIPVNARQLPLVMWHGFGVFSKTWETTPDGREGFQTIFLRRRFPVYLVDQPRRGGAGRSTVAGQITAEPDEQRWFNVFRLGVWPNFYPQVQFPGDPESLNQFFRQMAPDTGPLDNPVAVDAMSALFRRIGPGVLVTHSYSGWLGWKAVMDNPAIRAVVSYEPGSGFVFPEREVPPTLPSLTGPLNGVAVPMAQFKALTRIPIVLYYGDNIPEAPSTDPGLDNWRVRLAMARLWVEAVNRHGGDAKLVLLPEIGIRGNTHFPFSDLNNVQVADQMQQFLSSKRLDR
ncbi:alpha/beta fold hydrolase [Acidovorax sp. SUPP2522]|uniref:alpha/beta hydrolase n=1 Tax=unclassified Acidovorax TaxID=2684926 RepID=UPI00234A0B96|nr:MULTISPECIES: alpha/beta fold hydrolase [unclassified Acidovorax]WCM97629.1 alpha/beta fold hydrolase [Acidovorax sp. GBBC 1281]GKT13203.1 alpha/beta fold hydrolase [Acidovorax sp. SUPP2522]